MLIHLQDLEMLQAMLGTSDFPDALGEEYHIRQSMYHRSGGSGPLGPMGLIALVRALGLAPPEVPVDEHEKVDWSRVPRGTRVEALFFGAWRPGAFDHIVIDGILGVKLDDEDAVVQCRPHMVRVSVDQTSPDDSDAVEAPVAEVLDDAPFDWSEVQPGTEVWLCHSDEPIAPQEGALEGVLEDGKLSVVLDGERDPISVDAEDVRVKQ